MTTKKTSIFFMLLICIMGAWLFYLKYSVVLIEDRIRYAKKEIINEEKNMHILKAEWKELTTPERLQRLAKRYLNMQQIQPSQLKEYDASLFHSETGRYKRSKQLSKLVREVIARTEGDVD